MIRNTLFSLLLFRMKQPQRRWQIGVMGSAADLAYSAALAKVAEETGCLIAQSGNILIYGAEKDCDSLSTTAAKGAKKANGITVGITYGKGKDIWDKDGNTDIIIASGLERGGGREFVLVNSCDGIIAISGGSGTMTEMLIAYQLNIPIVVLSDSGGWAQKMSGQFFDTRNRLKAVPAKDPQEAVKTIIRLVEEMNKSLA